GGGWLQRRAPARALPPRPALPRMLAAGRRAGQGLTLNAARKPDAPARGRDHVDGCGRGPRWRGGPPTAAPPSSRAKHGLHLEEAEHVTGAVQLLVAVQRLFEERLALLGGQPGRPVVRRRADEAEEPLAAAEVPASLLRLDAVHPQPDALGQGAILLGGI